MAQEPQRQPGSPGDSVDAVKPGISEGPTAVPAVWLLEPEHLEQAERVDRLAGDVEVVTLLALTRYEGRDWEYFSTELAKYAMAVLAGWMYKGVILQKCRERGFGGLPPLGRPFTDDEVEELRGETVAKALHHFRVDVLMKQRWDSRKGATLRTYFIGQCLIRFQNIYRRWYGNESRARLSPSTDDHDWLALEAGPAADVTDRDAVDRTVAAQALAEVKDPRVRRAMILTANGRTQAEIAIDLDVTEKTVEKMLYNERKRQKGRRAG